MSRSNAYRISAIPGRNNEVLVEYARQCDDTNWQTDFTFQEESKFDEDVTFDPSNPPEVNGTSNPNWVVCYDNRGQADVTLLLQLVQTDETLTTELESFRGGTVELRFNNPTP